MAARETITIAVPCYNEEQTLPEFERRVRGVIDSLPQYDFELLFVDDGSRDGTAAVLADLARRDPRVKVLRLARNLGHQIALTAALDFASGDIVVTIDADLQDPPELIPQLVDRIHEGHDVVHAQRRTRAGETWFKLATARMFYALMKRIADYPVVQNSGDFRAFTRPVLEVARAFREPHRILRAMFGGIGFRQSIVQYDRDARFAGETHYPLAKMMKLAINGILSFSSAPIRGIIWMAIVLWAGSLVYAGKALVDNFILHTAVKGWTSLILLLTVYTGLILMCIAIVGAYISRAFEQGQQRPLYWVNAFENIDLVALKKNANTVAREVRICEAILDLNQRALSEQNGRPEQRDNGHA